MLCNPQPLMAYCFIWSSVQPFDNILSEDEDVDGTCDVPNLFYAQIFPDTARLSSWSTVIFSVLRAVCCLLVFAVFSLKPVPTREPTGKTYLCTDPSLHCRCCCAERKQTQAQSGGFTPSYFLLDHFQYWHKAPHCLILLCMWRQDCHKCLPSQKREQGKVALEGRAIFFSLGTHTTF